MMMIYWWWWWWWWWWRWWWYLQVHDGDAGPPISALDPSFNVLYTHLHMDQVFIMMMIFVVILMVSLMIQTTMKILNLKHSTFIELDQSLMLLLIFQYLGDCSVPCVWYSCPDMRQTCWYAQMRNTQSENKFVSIFTDIDHNININIDININIMINHY